MVGVDARGLSHGAVAFGRWLAGGLLNTVYGTHVVEWVPQHTDLPKADPAEVLASAARFLQPLRDDTRFEELGAVAATHAEVGLAKAIEAKQANALVVGRRAPRVGSPLVRLGRTARRLLRSLPVPVVVVPPDLEAEQIGRGPVLLAVDLTESCGAAAAFAARVAATMARPLMLVHAVHPPDRGPYVPPDLWGHSMAALHRRSARDLHAWADRHSVGAAERVLEEGPAAHVLDRVATQHDAALIVLGSRQLGGVQRLFMTSLGSELAASAMVPVAVVPPDSHD